MSLISEGLLKLGLNPEQPLIDKLTVYVNLILKWNRVYNLTAARTSTEIAVSHVLDSAASYSFVKGRNVLDVGTGAGLPGIVLAILDKSLKITLIDSNNKKVRFLRQCKIELELDNINLVHSRIEDFNRQLKFDSVISRAFASFDDFAANCLSFVKTGGILVALKGKWTENPDYRVKVNKISVPFLEAQRHIIIYKHE